MVICVQVGHGGVVWIRATRDRKAKNVEVVFVFDDRFYAFILPNFNRRVANHASVATRRQAAKRTVVIGIETVGTLEDKPRFVFWMDWASTVKFGNVKGHRFSPRGCRSDLWSLVRTDKDGNEDEDG